MQPRKELKVLIMNITFTVINPEIAKKNSCALQKYQ